MRPAFLLCTALLAATVPVSPASGYAEFQKEFLSIYAKGADADPDFRKLARKAKCYVCHQGKEDRTNYNRYGLALTEHLGEEDKKDKEKIAEALATVADQSSDPNDPAAKTFGELIGAAELPGGSLEDSKKEPPAKDDSATSAE